MGLQVKYLEWLEAGFEVVPVGMWCLDSERGRLSERGLRKETDLVRGKDSDSVKVTDLERVMARLKARDWGSVEEKGQLKPKDPVKVRGLEMALGRLKERDPVRVKGLTKRLVWGWGWEH